MIGAFAIITQSLITNLCDAFFMSLAAGGAFTVHAGSQSMRGGEKKTDLRQIHTHMRTATSSNGEKWVNAG